MDKKLSSLYRIGGVTGGLSGFLMLASSLWYIFGLSSIASETQLESIGKIGIFHGIGVITIILLVPTVLAGYGLLSSEANLRSTLGLSFAIPWLVIELIAHCSHTAPLNSLSELAGEPATATIGTALYTLWEEWGEALFMTGAFLCALFALCYGSALLSWGNQIAGYLFFLALIAFPAGILLDLGIHLHVLIRGIAFLFFGGVLIRAPYEDEI